VPAADDWPAGLPGFAYLWFQAWIADPAAPAGARAPAPDRHSRVWMNSSASAIEASMSRTSWTTSDSMAATFA
jgi:hypothetical protein